MASKGLVTNEIEQNILTLIYVKNLFNIITI